MILPLLETDPENIEARKVETWVALGRHDFKQALELAERLRKEVPDDEAIYGMLADAQMELGMYAEAEKTIQWMLDLNPGAVAGLTRAAYFRELTGDDEGALQLFERCYPQIPEFEVEDRAWILVHIAKIKARGGKLEAAERILDGALQMYPDYHYAVQAKAEILTEMKRPEMALGNWMKLYEVAPHPENLFYLGRAFSDVGQTQLAELSFSQFEEGARGELMSTDNANGELIEYYLNEGNRPEEALRIARIRMEQQPNLFSRELLAECLLANNESEEALSEIRKVLEYGIRSSRIFYRAARISLANGKQDEASSLLQRAVEANPRSDWSERARNDLSRLQDPAT